MRPPFAKRRGSGSDQPGPAGAVARAQQALASTIEADTNGDGIADLVIALTTANPAYAIGGGDFVP